MPGDLDRILDLFERNNVCAQTINGRHNFRLLISESLRGICATNQARISRNRCAVMVDIRLTVRLVLTYIGEIAQHVKASKFDVTTHGRRVSRTVTVSYTNLTLPTSDLV